MGERRPVPEADQRMHDGRRMDNDLDQLVRKSEQEMGLDQLEPLVRERRRVDGDLRPHVPCRMGERLVDAHVLELVVASGRGRGRQKQ